MYSQKNILEVPVRLFFRAKRGKSPLVGENYSALYFAMFFSQ